MTPSDLAERWPRLYHLAEAGAWPSIRRHGLLSTTALLDLFEVEPERRAALEGARRTASHVLEHPEHGTAVLRDNLALHPTALERTLDAMTTEEWCRTLNARVFLWLTEARWQRLRATRLYRDRPHDLVVLDTASLLAAHGDRVELSPLNSGAVFALTTVRRGSQTFRPLPGYDWEARRRTAEPVVELTVLGGVPDAAEHVVDVRRV